MAKAIPWACTDAHARKRGEQTGLDTLANYVPAAAVIRRVQALSGIIGRKGLVGGSSRPV